MYFCFSVKMMFDNMESAYNKLFKGQPFCPNRSKESLKWSIGCTLDDPWCTHPIFSSKIKETTPLILNTEGPFKKQLLLQKGSKTAWKNHGMGSGNVCYRKLFFEIWGLIRPRGVIWVKMIYSLYSWWSMIFTPNFFFQN